MNKNNIKDMVIIPALDKCKHFIPKKYYIEHFEGVIFYGAEGAILDSLNLVGLVFIIEDEIKIKIGKEIKITTEDVLNTDSPPFLNLDTLSSFIIKKITND